MNRRFVVLMKSDVASANALTERLKTLPHGYWHWVDDAWLVTTKDPSVSARTLGDWILEAPDIHATQLLVLRTDGDSTEYWGWQNKKAWPWFAENWI